MSKYEDSNASKLFKTYVRNIRTKYKYAPIIYTECGNDLRECQLKVLRIRSKYAPTQKSFDNINLLRFCQEYVKYVKCAPKSTK